MKKALWFVVALLAILTAGIALGGFSPPATAKCNPEVAKCYLHQLPKI